LGEVDVSFVFDCAAVAAAMICFEVHLHLIVMLVVVGGCAENRGNQRYLNSKLPEINPAIYKRFRLQMKPNV
jgi:hypothetical protein